MNPDNTFSFPFKNEVSTESLILLLFSSLFISTIILSITRYISFKFFEESSKIVFILSTLLLINILEYPCWSKVFSFLNSQFSSLVVSKQTVSFS